MHPGPEVSNAKEPNKSDNPGKAVEQELHCRVQSSQVKDLHKGRTAAFTHGVQLAHVLVVTAA